MKQYQIFAHDTAVGINRKLQGEASRAQVSPTMDPYGGLRMSHVDTLSAPCSLRELPDFEKKMVHSTILFMTPERAEEVARAGTVKRGVTIEVVEMTGKGEAIDFVVLDKENKIVYDSRPEVPYQFGWDTSEAPPTFGPGGAEDVLRRMNTEHVERLHREALRRMRPQADWQHLMSGIALDEFAQRNNLPRRAPGEPDEPYRKRLMQGAYRDRY